MLTEVERDEVKQDKFEQQEGIVWYDIDFSADKYTFPQEALIHHVWFDADDIHIELTDGRKLSIPIWWMPTVFHAKQADRNAYEISRNRKMIIWDPEKCAINDELCIDDYLSEKNKLQR